MDNKSAPPAYPGSNNFAAPQYPQQGNFQPTYPQQMGYPQQSGYPQQQFVAQPVVMQAQPNIVVVGGGCPNCGVGVLTDDYGCCAIFLAIFFFPIGILCCLAMRERRCSNCRAIF